MVQRGRKARSKAEVASRRVHRSPWWFIVLVLVYACTSNQDLPAPPGSIAPSDGAELQLRPVTGIVTRSSSDWDETELTCMDHDEGLRDCIVSTFDARRIVLLGPGTRGEKYVLGARIGDGATSNGRWRDRRGTWAEVGACTSTSRPRERKRSRPPRRPPWVPRSPSSSTAGSPPHRSWRCRSAAGTWWSRAGSRSVKRRPWPPGS